MYNKSSIFRLKSESKMQTSATMILAMLCACGSVQAAFNQDLTLPETSKRLGDNVDDSLSATDCANFDTGLEMRDYKLCHDDNLCTTDVSYVTICPRNCEACNVKIPVVVEDYVDNEDYGCNEKCQKWQTRKCHNGFPHFVNCSGVATERIIKCQGENFGCKETEFSSTEYEIVSDDDAYATLGNFIDDAHFIGARMYNSGIQSFTAKWKCAEYVFNEEYPTGYPDTSSCDESDGLNLP